MIGDRERCIAAGMDAYLTKPIRAREMRKSIESLMSGARSSSHTTLLDRAGMLDCVGGNTELLRSVIGVFLKNCPDLISRIRSGVAESDSGALRIAAHTLKVALGAFGAPRLAQLAQQLEEASRQEEHPGASDLLAAFQQESERPVEALSRFSGSTAL